MAMESTARPRRGVHVPSGIPLAVWAFAVAGRTVILLRECWGVAMSGYRAAIDFGTSYTVTASRSGAQAAPAVVPLVEEGRLSSAVALDDSGVLRAGPLVEQVAALTPDRVERTPKRCLDQPDVMLGRKPVKTADLVAAVLVYVQDELHRHFNGRDADEVVLTHPARWEPGDPRMKRLEEAAQLGGPRVRQIPARALRCRAGAGG